MSEDPAPNLDTIEALLDVPWPDGLSHAEALGQLRVVLAYARKLEAELRQERVEHNMTAMHAAHAELDARAMRAALLDVKFYFEDDSPVHDDANARITNLVDTVNAALDATKPFDVEPSP
jgi:hypothetical protein